MRVFLLLFFFSYLSVKTVAQDATIRNLQLESAKTFKAEIPDTSKRSWRLGGLYNLNIGQGTLSNWAAGGDDFSLTINSFLNLFSAYHKGRNSWDNNLDVSLGYL